MTSTRSLAVLVSVALTGALGMVARAAGPAPHSAAADGTHLRLISSKVSGKGTSLVIEATDPVAYIATRPDPLTVLVDVRNASAEGVTNGVAPDAKSPIAGVLVEPNEESGPGSRVRVTLLQPVGYRVRSDRNTIVIDFDKVSAKAAPYVLPPTSRTPADPVATLGLAKGSSTTPESAAAAPPVVAAATSTAPVAPAPAPAAKQAQPQQPSAAVNPSDQPKRYSGHPVSLDFQGADLRAVLRTFAEISGLNVVIDPAVQGSVDVALKDVPWDQALDIILRANKLGYIVDGTIVRVAPLSTLADEETQRRKLTEEQALAGSLQVLTKTLSYAHAEELQNLLTKSALSQRGIVQVDPRTNTVIITDLPEKLAIANDLINTLDKAQPQVEIEARIVQANKNYARQLGIQWGFNGKVDPALGNTTNLAFPNNGSIGGRVGTTTQGPAGGQQTSTAVNLGAPSPTSAIGLALGSVNGAFNLDFALSAAETSGNLRVLSTPRVSAQNNMEAEITQGVQIPIQTVANNTVTVSFRDAALTLKVTPQITAAGTVIMKIALENAQPDFSRSVNGIPPINTQRANTQVLVSDGQTTVIGGIFVSQEQAQNDRTPGLSQVPLLKWLFKRDQVSDQSTELLIFITPKITKI
ncbi:MAG TPA: type IV pilus secretin PilQ [Vicinamibacterales bacterium]|jgi:type IV pilus assembly protein PilQ